MQAYSSESEILNSVESQMKNDEIQDLVTDTLTYDEILELK